MIECNREQIGVQVSVDYPGYRDQVYEIDDIEPRRNAALIRKPEDFRGHWITCMRLNLVETTE